MTVFAYPDGDLFEEERKELEGYGRGLFIAFKGAGKKKAMVGFKDLYVLLFLIPQNLIIVIYAVKYDFLVLGGGGPLITNRYLEETAGIRKPWKGSKFFQGSTAQVLKIVQQTEVEFPLALPEIALCNTFNEIPNNSGLVYSHLLCVTDITLKLNILQGGFLIPYPFPKAIYGEKLRQLFLDYNAKPDTLEKRITIKALVIALGAFYAQTDATIQPISDYGLVPNIALLNYYDNPYLDFNVLDSNDEDPAAVYAPVPELFDTLDPEHPYVINFIGQVQYDSVKYIDVSVPQFWDAEPPPLEDIEPGDLRYVFDVPLEQADRYGAHYPPYLTFYFDGTELKNKPTYQNHFIFPFYGVHIFSSAFTIEGEFISFDSAVELNINFIVTTGRRYLTDYNTPSYVTAEAQQLVTGPGYTGYHPIAHFYNVSDGLDYYRTIDEADYTEGLAQPLLPGVANFIFKAAALPEIKTAQMPLISVNPSFPGDQVHTMYGKIVFNGYETPYTVGHIWNGGFSTGTLSGLSPESDLTAYTICFSYFGELIVRKETGFLQTDYASIFRTTPDTVVDTYIVSKEQIAANITDINSLLAFLSTIDPIATIETGQDFESTAAWQLTSKRTNTSTGGGFNDMENYPSVLFLFDTLWGEITPTFRQYAGYDLTSMVRMFVGATNHFNINPYINVQFVPGINVLSNPIKYQSNFSIPPNAERFHRIYLVDLAFNQIGHCDLIWSIDFQIALIGFMRHHREVVNLALDTKDAADLTEGDLSLLAAAEGALTAFTANYGSKILYNDFASYEFLYYLFLADAVLNPFYLEYYTLFPQEVTMVVTTDALQAVSEP